MVKPKTDGRQHCPRCNRPARRLRRCVVCRDQGCVENCVQKENGACVTCESIGADEGVRAGSEEE